MDLGCHGSPLIVPGLVSAGARRCTVCEGHCGGDRAVFVRLPALHGQRPLQPAEPGCGLVVEFTGFNFIFFVRFLFENSQSSTAFFHFVGWLTTAAAPARRAGAPPLHVHPLQPPFERPAQGPMASRKTEGFLAGGWGPVVGRPCLYREGTTPDPWVSSNRIDRRTRKPATCFGLACARGPKEGPLGQAIAIRGLCTSLRRAWPASGGALCLDSSPPTRPPGLVRPRAGV